LRAHKAIALVLVQKIGKLPLALKMEYAFKRLSKKKKTALIYDKCLSNDFFRKTR